MKNTKIYEITTHDNGIQEFEIGKKYSAIGICGTTDGILVKGKLIKIDGWGAYIEYKGIPHLCNEKTLFKI